MPRKGSEAIGNSLKPTLTVMMEKFIEEYPKDFNATAAARRAGYSEKAAKQTGHKLLKHPEIQKRLTSHLRKINRRGVLSMQDVLERDSAMADFDPIEVFEDGTLMLKRLVDIPTVTRKCINKIKKYGDGGWEVTFHPPHPSLERLAKFHGIVGGHVGALPQPDSEVEVDETVEEDIERAKIAAEWLDMMSQRHGTDSIETLIQLLRHPKILEEPDAGNNGADR